jgi:hypothetical protein
VGHVVKLGRGAVRQLGGLSSHTVGAEAGRQ